MDDRAADTGGKCPSAPPRLSMQCVQQQTAEHIVAVPQLMTGLIGESKQTASPNELLKLAQEIRQHFLDEIGIFFLQAEVFQWACIVGDHILQFLGRGSEGK